MGYSEGEWEVEDSTNVVAGDRLVANTGGYSSNVRPSRLENEANAHLIAASPVGHELANAVLSMNPEDFDDFLEIREIARKFKAKVEEK